MLEKLTHVDSNGRLQMVDVGAKEKSARRAIVRGEIRMRAETAALVCQQKVAKGNVLEAARLAGIMAAKRTGDIIPLCHPLNVTAIEVDFVIGEDRIEVETQVRVEDRTGVEMEAFTASAVALLTIYDMCKAVDKGMVISRLRLVEKTGGASGKYLRLEE